MLNVLAEAFHLAGRFEDAERAASEAFQVAETQKYSLPHVYLTLGSAQRAAGRPREAREAFELALRELDRHAFLRSDPESLRAIYGNLAEIYDGARDYERTAGMLERLLAQYPDDGMARHRVLIWLGDCCMAMGRSTEARPYYEEVVRPPVATGEELQHARDALALLAE